MLYYIILNKVLNNELTILNFISLNYFFYELLFNERMNER